ncbi:hypothetical protein [Amycolatopsis plumensis]|uniref:hypothetical protein n=1 Tax=Amycolatopsis plumensis TaxID=236508 RepID=UPI0036241836
MSSREHLTRRDLLRLAGGSAAAVAAALWLPGTAAAGTFSPIRPPATPLIVRSPYLSTWQAADTLPAPGRASGPATSPPSAASPASTGPPTSSPARPAARP